MNKEQLEEHKRKHREAMHKFLLTSKYRGSLPPEALQFVTNPLHKTKKELK